MVEKFIENLVSELNENCANKESKTFVQWTTNDVNLDITKCRKYCDIDSGYMWNGFKICDSCDKNLHKNLDRFIKSNTDIIFDNMILERKIEKLETENELMKTQCNEIELLKIQCDYFKSMIDIMEHKLNTLHKMIDNTKININDINNDINEIDNNVKNNNIFTENILQAYDIKFKNMSNENNNNNNNNNNNVQNLENRFDDFTNNIYNVIDVQINNKLKNVISRENALDELHNNLINNNKIIDKQVDYQNIDNDNIKNNDKKNNYRIKSNIKIFNKCKVRGIGYVLNANTISPGNVKRGYTYQSKSNENIIFKIKDFENNFCPQEFNYPDSNISIRPDFIHGSYKDIELYDEFVCIKSD
jgi:hypothetical protein